MLSKRVLVLVGAVALLSTTCAFAAPKTKTAPSAKKTVSVSKKKAALPKNVAAIVNGEKITKQQLQDKLYKWYAPQGVEEMIMTTLVDREAKKSGVVVKDSEINAKIAEIEKRASAGGTSFSDYLKQIGKTVDYARAMIKMDLQATAVARKTEKVTAQDYAQYRKAESILILNTQTPPAPGEKDAAKVQAAADKAMTDKLAEITNKIKGGMSFEAAAKEYSQDTNTKDKGGDVGWFGPNQMPPEFQKAALALKPGEISEPVRAPYGYHLIKLVALGQNATGADKKQIEDKILQSRVNTKAWIMQLRDKAKVESDLVAPRRPQPMMSRSKLTPLPANAGRPIVRRPSLQRGPEAPPPPPAPPVQPVQPAPAN